MINIKALITGASSGIGKSMATYLSSLGYDLILVARNKEKLEELKANLNTNIRIISLDLSDIDNVELLWNSISNEDIDLFINNAGYGLYGEFTETNLDKELNMIDLNVKTVHYLSKKYIQSRLNKNSGLLLNVASSAGFMAGPKLSSYYASKSYVLRLTEAIYEELRRKKSNIHVSVLCPGPVDTNFNDRANCTFSVKGLNSDKVAKYAIDMTLKHKLHIIPSFKMKLTLFGIRLIPTRLLLKMNYNIQKKKEI